MSARLDHVIVCHCFLLQVPQDDTALLKTLDDILSKHFSQINTKLASTNDAT